MGGRPRYKERQNERRKGERDRESMLCSYSCTYRIALVMNWLAVYAYMPLPPSDLSTTEAPWPLAQGSRIINICSTGLIKY